MLTFRQVARERSFSRAAQTLSLTLPSVSYQVAQLEREMGGKLLERGPGGPRPTVAGEALLVHADAHRRALRPRRNPARRDLAHQHAHLRIGAVPSALAGLVPAALQRVRQHHAGALVTVAEGRSDELPACVRSGELHPAVGFQDAARAPDHHEGLRRHELLREDFLVALPRGHRLAGQDRVRLADVADHDWIAASPDGIIVRACRTAGFEPRLISITRDQLAIRALITRGLAVTLAAQLLADAFELAELRPIDGRSPARNVYALLPPGGQHRLAKPMLEALTESADALDL